MSEVMELVEVGYNHVDPEHFENVMDGVIDVVTGAESLTGSYTWAQNYLYGCLDAADILKEQKIGGMENMVTDGLKAIWDYIVKMFKSIWGFFFGSGEDSASGGTEKAEKKVKENKEELESAVAPKTAEQAQATVKKIKTKVEKIEKDPKASSATKAKAKALHERIIDSATGKSKEPKGAAMRELMVHLVETSEESGLPPLKEALAALDERVKSIIKRFNIPSPDDKSANIKDSVQRLRYQGERNTIHGEFERLAKTSGYKSLMDARSLDQALAGQKQILTMLDTAKRNNEFYKKKKTESDKEINELKSLMASDKDNAELKDKLNDMKIWGSQILNAKQHMQAYVKACEKASDALNVYCGVK